MTTPLFLPLPGNEAMAAALARLAGTEPGAIETRQFPDGETYLRLASDPRGRPVVLVCTLDRPDAKLVPLALAAATARELGATSVGLVAPYLAYMRQDTRFREGEAVSARIFARLLSPQIDWLVTVDPHLHRLKRLDAVYDVPARAVQAAPLLADWIAENVAHPLIIGPDAESEQWVAAIGERCGAPWRVMDKHRQGDRAVTVALPPLDGQQGRTPVLVDDIVSSGQTMLAAARALGERGFPPPACLAVHALFAEDAGRGLQAVASAVVSTDSVPHSTNRLPLASLLIGPVMEMLGAERQR